MAVDNRYRINEKIYLAGAPELMSVLAKAHAEKLRPLCMCRPNGVSMYVAKVNGKFIVKRFPETGSEHAPSCSSYEPPPELSGLGQVSGSAIQENPADGTTSLKFDFALTKRPGKSAPVAGEGGGDSVKTDGTKLTLRGTLHYLIEEAGFNRWTPAMAGKRNWFIFRRHLIEAAENKLAKGANLAEILYIPESFNLDQKEQITQRRQAQWGKINAQQSGTRRLMLAIGEVKEISPSRYGHKIQFKHLPDAPMMLNDDIFKRMQKRFEAELGLWDAIEDSHLLAICTFGVTVTGYATVEELALIVVTDNWIPFENVYEKSLLETLTQSNRRFMKGLRYNLPPMQPLAAAVLTDTQPKATALYIDAPGASDEQTSALDKLIEESDLSSWRWDTVAGMPDLPAASELPQ